MQPTREHIKVRRVPGEDMQNGGQSKKRGVHYLTNSIESNYLQETEGVHEAFGMSKNPKIK